MSQLSCNCLNVTVNVTGDYKSQEKLTSSLFSQNFSHPLVTKYKSLFEVQLDVAGIVVVSGSVCALLYLFIMSAQFEEVGNKLAFLLDVFIDFHL